MDECRTTADILAHVYERLEGAIPPPPAGSPMTLLEAWAAVFTGNGRSLSDVIEGVCSISRLHGKLKEQISASVKLSAVRKRSAMATVSTFDQLFRLDRFHDPAQAVRPVCNETNRGNLGLIGLSIADEFSEPPVTSADAEELTTALADVKKMLADSNLPLELRRSLLRHVDAMLWWLAHPEMANAQDLFETVGAAMIVARQMQDRESISNQSAPSSGARIATGLATIAEKLATMVGYTWRLVHTADGITSEGKHILDTIMPPS